jgi:nicotinamidase-related amidase
MNQPLNKPMSQPMSKPLSQSAVLALHYQNDVLHPDGKIRVGLGADSRLRAGVIAAAGELLKQARERALPIVHVRVAFRPDYADLLANAPIFLDVARIGAVCEGSWGAEFYAGLAPIAGDAREFTVTHKRINGFYDSPLETILRAIGARRLVIAGVATHSVVESTVRHAVDMGYEVAVAANACAAGDPDAHAASLQSMRLIAHVCDVDKLWQS